MLLQTGFIRNLSQVGIPNYFNSFETLANDLNNNDIDFRKIYINVENNLPENINIAKNNITTIKNNIDMAIESLSIKETEKLYSVFSFITQKYIWGNGKDNYVQELPFHIGYIWFKLSEKLNIVCACSYASVILLNCNVENLKYDYSDDITLLLEKITVYNNLTNTEDEINFYKIHMAIEIVGGKLIHLLKNMSSSMSEEEFEKLLRTTLNFLKISTKILKTMYAVCKIDVFWNKIRIYLGGFDNLDFFPNGLRVSMTDIVLNGAGGSGAQSTLIQLCDKLFEITHENVHANNIINKMRIYMPHDDKQFLDNSPSFKKIYEQYNNDNITQLYNDCILSLKTFRSAHVHLVHKYIVENLEKNNQNNNVHSDGGTSGLARGLGNNTGKHPLTTILETMVEQTKKSLINNKVPKNNYHLLFASSIGLLILLFFWHR